MTNRHVIRTVAATVFTAGLVALGATSARAQNTTSIPDEGGPITMAGCFTTGVIGHDTDDERFVLAKPMVGTVASVPEATCTASSSDQMIKLQDLHHVKMGAAQAGRWVQVSGRLEGNHRSDGVREVHVKSFMLIPVVVPPPAVAAVIMPAPAPQASVETPAPRTPTVEYTPTPAPVPTAGVTVRKKLPKTATSLPLVGLIGVLALAGAFGLRFVTGRPTSVA
jgi:hypothetical protein